MLTRVAQAVGHAIRQHHEIFRRRGQYLQSPRYCFDNAWALGFVQRLPTPGPEDSPEQEEEHGEYYDDFKHGAYILSYRSSTCLRGSGGRERGQHGLAYGAPL